MLFVEIIGIRGLIVINFKTKSVVQEVFLVGCGKLDQCDTMAIVRQGKQRERRFPTTIPEPDNACSPERSILRLLRCFSALMYCFSFNKVLMNFRVLSEPLSKLRRRILMNNLTAK